MIHTPETKRLAVYLYHRLGVNDNASGFTRKDVVRVVYKLTGNEVGERSITRWVKEANDLGFTDVDSILPKEFEIDIDSIIDEKYKELSNHAKEKSISDEEGPFNTSFRERQLSGRLRDAQKRIQHLQKRADLTREICETIENYVKPAPAIVLPNKRSHHSQPQTCMIIGQDFHYNEKVEQGRFISALEGEFPKLSACYNAYDLDIAEKRIRYYHQLGLTEILDKRDPKVVERVIIAYIGDLIQGSIHNSDVTNCTGNIEASLMLADILTSELLCYRKELPWAEIDIIVKVGNHGRILNPNQRKSVNAKTVSENYDYLVGGTLRRRLENQKNLTVENKPTLMSIRDVYGETHAYWHGDCIRGGGGISKLPMFGIARAVYDQTILMLEKDIKLHHIHCGHWHMHYEGEYGLGVVMIGRSLVGATERSQSLGYSGKVSQRIVWCTPEYGLGARYPLDVPLFLPEG